MKKEIAIFLTTESKKLPHLIEQVLAWNQCTGAWALTPDAAQTFDFKPVAVFPYVIDRNTVVIVSECDESKIFDVGAITNRYKLTVKIKERKIAREPGSG